MILWHPYCLYPILIHYMFSMFWMMPMDLGKIIKFVFVLYLNKEVIGIS